MSQDGCFPTAEASIGELPLEIGVKTPTTGEKVQDVLTETSTEEHVNPRVTAAAKAGQQHGDSKSHITRF